jgi:hypothetical protein
LPWFRRHILSSWRQYVRPTLCFATHRTILSYNTDYLNKSNRSLLLVPGLRDLDRQG